MNQTLERPISTGILQTQFATMPFREYPLAEPLQRAIAAAGYTHPTPIQAEFIPKVLAGADFIGQSRTGTGKTAAFLIPLLQQLQNAPPQTPLVLVLCPVRELVRQVVTEAEKLAVGQNIRVAAIYGGQAYRRQITALENGCQLVVGTPGRVLDLIKQNALKTNTIRFLVLDECDRMLDIGFRPDIERICRHISTDRQTLLLSATLSPDIQKLTQRFMREPQLINMSADEVAVDRIEQFALAVAPEQKIDILFRLLVREKPKQCLVFCQTKSHVRRVARQLGQRIRGVMAIQGDLPQGKRNQVMQALRSGEARILVATDIVGRGIDVQEISHVINFDIPEDPDIYVHRIGRTGRMGKMGKAFTLVTPEQGKLLSQIELYINRMLEPDEVSGEVIAQSVDRLTRHQSVAIPVEA